MSRSAALALVPSDEEAAVSGPAVESRESFIAAMRQAATGVTVVTTREGGRRLGVTVSAMSSVSADPPLVLVCIHHMSPVCAAIEASGVFAVNVLAEGQRAVSDVFAGRVKTASGERFDCGDWSEGATGAPVLEGAAATFHCHLEAGHRHGTHRVFVGRVARAGGLPGARPLVYSDGDYHQLPENGSGR